MTQRRRSNANDRALPILKPAASPRGYGRNAQHRSSILEVVMKILTATHSLAHASDDAPEVRSKASQPCNHSRTVIVASVWLAFFVVAAVVAPGNAGAQGQAVQLARECAVKEVAAITAIEDHGAADDLPANRLGEAGQTMLDARLACYAGRVTEALALYDRVLALGPVASTTGQRR
jgi:hypothetical protein